MGEQDCVSPTNIIYVVQMHEKLEAMSTFAQEHMAETQKRQKTWYDQRARTRNFEPGTQVLVMFAYRYRSRRCSSPEEARRSTSCSLHQSQVVPQEGSILHCGKIMFGSKMGPWHSQVLSAWTSSLYLRLTIKHYNG